MNDVQTEKRQLTIKTGVVQRYVIAVKKCLPNISLTRELGMYKQEVDEQAERVKEYMTKGKDDWDVKKQVSSNH